MPISTDEVADSLPVKVFPKKGDIKKGMLYYGKEGPILELDTGNILEDYEEVRFSFSENSRFVKLRKIDSSDQFNLKPEAVVQLNYSPDSYSHFDIYPPSTDSWLAHVVESGYKSVFTIQSINGKEKKLLTISDATSMELYYAGIVQSFEPSILIMNRDWNVNNQIIHTDIPDVDIYDILKKESLSWATLSKLVEGISIPNLAIGKTMGETLNQLVPQSFSPNIRNQIMAFLGWLETASIPKEDPINFVMKHRSAGVYNLLVRGHLQCMIDGVEHPQYVRVMHMADKGQLELTRRPQSEAAERDSWTLVRLKLHEMFPDWMGRVIEYAMTLQDNGQIVTELPVSRDDARNTRTAWSDRFAMANHALFVRGHVHKQSLGLISAIYMGAAHRWPHKHLDWSARLGYTSDKPQHIQIMVMPPSALERVLRVIPTVRLIDWEMSSANLSLYSNKERRWKLNNSLIVKSLERKRSVRQLSNEFGRWKGRNHYHLSLEQARILDLISWALYLSSLESNQYSKFYGINNSKIKQELDNMHDFGVFELQYFLIPEKLRSLCFLANGPSETICSMSRAFLKHTPSSQIRLTDSGSSCIIVSRVPEDEQYELVTRLNDAANETGISLRVLPISAYAGYRNNLYSRLLKNDGLWDDDVSGLLNQVRLQPKNDE